MRLIRFSVLNYRSITTAHKIEMSNLTVLVGKNNEGKSNILRALSLAMYIMELYQVNPRMLNMSIRYIRPRYDWERDYPLSLHEKKPNGYSSIDLTFELTEEELQSIRRLTGIRLNTILPIRVSINGEGAKIDIPKRGTPAFANNENKRRIIEFICNKIDFKFIKAVRTDYDAIEVIKNLIEKELSALENNAEYVKALTTINKLQQDILDSIADRIINPLQTFLPSVKGIQLRVQKGRRLAAPRRNIEVIIDDGTPTPIQLKGDGVKSLTALAMLNIQNQSDRVSVIAIEEPESHLHPAGARQLYETITLLSANHQVILTTHSPLFINRMNLRENIIVNDGKATTVKKVKEIRDALGTIVSDNLINAENILVVEGEDDKIVLDKLLPRMSEKIKKAIQNGTLVIDYIGGAGNLSYILSTYRNIQCRYHVLLDNDDAGRRAGHDAQTQGLLTTRNITYTLCNGFPNSELEDCYNKSSYEQAIQSEFGVNLGMRMFRGNKKWSDRVAACFKAQGKQWNEIVEKRVKIAVANAILLNTDQVLDPHKRSSIDALVSALEDMLS